MDGEERPHKTESGCSMCRESRGGAMFMAGPFNGYTQCVHCCIIWRPDGTVAWSYDFPLGEAQLT